MVNKQKLTKRRIFILRLFLLAGISTIALELIKFKLLEHQTFKQNDELEHDFYAFGVDSLG